MALRQQSLRKDQSLAKESDSAEDMVAAIQGAQPGASPEYVAAARALARELHQANAKLIYGGGTTGLMGELARTLVSLSGLSAVHGFHRFNPRSQTGGADSSDDFGRLQEQEPSITESEHGTTTVGTDMQSRKRLMAQQVLDGGPGSGFVAELITWNQLGVHDKGIVLLNIDGFWDGFLVWLRKAVEQRFIGQGNKDIAVERTKG
ncbi:hypothetical protein BDV29DRAFT_201270 [Aspergillus leporis]|uniref:Lysine decarboxylase-like protein n=1 Tax=Aspergillus leporis TaxID=41062 RepID=A0A5N5XH36_9EURO|nr:hypothetical protein BDV29DRAFT_201270 [Aspergillus leporis]